MKSNPSIRHHPFFDSDTEAEMEASNWTDGPLVSQWQQTAKNKKCLKCQPSIFIWSAEDIWILSSKTYALQHWLYTSLFLSSKSPGQPLQPTKTSQMTSTNHPKKVKPFKNHAKNPKTTPKPQKKQPKTRGRRCWGGVCLNMSKYQKPWFLWDIWECLWSQAHGQKVRVTAFLSSGMRYPALRRRLLVSISRSNCTYIQTNADGPSFLLGKRSSY